jgi:hypothetical protein
MGGGHDKHEGHDVFDDAPVRELPPDEPRTPGWIPALGLGLLVVTLVVWMARSGGPAPAATAETGSASAPVQAAPPPQGQPVPPQPVMPKGGPQAAGSGPARQMTPEQAKELQKRIEEMKAARARAAGSAAPPPAPGR